MSELGLCKRCGVSITSDHEYAWCAKCGEALPAELIERLSARLNAVQQEERKAQTIDRSITLYLVVGLLILYLFSDQLDSIEFPAKYGLLVLVLGPIAWWWFSRG